MENFTNRRAAPAAPADLWMGGVPLWVSGLSGGMAWGLRFVKMDAAASFRMRG
jgi:hypothetical protein